MSHRRSIDASRPRPLVQVLGVVALAAAVPIAVVLRLGAPVPGADAWHLLWRHHRLTVGLALPLGEAMFLLLWCWSAAGLVGLVWRQRTSGAVVQDEATEDVPAASAPPAPVDYLPVSSWSEVTSPFEPWREHSMMSEVERAGDLPLDADCRRRSSLTSATEPPVETAVSFDTPRPAASAWVEPEWHVLVTVLGLVTAGDRDGRRADFEKSKSLELLTWLTQHRERPTRGAARTALWDSAVKDSTFANVVSDLRRGLARLVTPPDGDEWIGRTLTDDLPLDPRVVTDAELLLARLHASRGLPPDEAARLLRPGLALVTGMPFSGAGTSFTWADGEGHTSAAVLLITTAATELASHLLQLDDIDGVFWATGQGLKVLPGHEELIAVRMYAHSARGDLAGVRLEWEQYERSIEADPWEHGSPSPKLASLRRDLLGSGAGRRSD